MQSGKDFKVVIAGEFGSGRTTFATRFVAAKQNKQKVGQSSRVPLALPAASSSFRRLTN